VVHPKLQSSRNSWPPKSAPSAAHILISSNWTRLHEPFTLQFVTKNDDQGNPVPHRLSVGQAVTIELAFVGGLLSLIYNGTFEVEQVIDYKTFSYKMNGVPSGPADDPTQHPFNFRARWQTLYAIIEGNIFDVYRSDISSASGAFGVLTYGYEQGPPYMFRQMIIRENLIRHVDHAESTATAYGFSAGLRLDSVENAIVQENIIDFEGPNPNHHLNSKTVKSFNNSTASGALVRGHTQTDPDDPNQKDDELASLIEEAMILSI